MKRIVRVILDYAEMSSFKVRHTRSRYTECPRNNAADLICHSIKTKIVGVTAVTGTGFVKLTFKQ